VTTASGWLLTDARGLPADGPGNRGEQGPGHHDAPAIQAFAATHQLLHVTVVADAGMVSTVTRRRSSHAGFHKPDLASIFCAPSRAGGDTVT
jgi:hypothetical protein